VITGCLRRRTYGQRKRWRSPDKNALDRIDEIVPPGTDIGPLDQAQAYVPPAIQKTELRRRPLNERSAA